MYQGAPVEMQRHLKDLQLPDVTASSGPPGGERIVYYMTDKLPVQQNSALDGADTPPVQDRTQHSQSLGNFLPNLIDVRRPD